MSYQITLQPVKFNCYVCETCTLVTTTADIHEGVTPFMIRCPACCGKAISRLYPKGKIPANIPTPDLEWYKPSGKDYQKLSAAMKEHVDHGGLDMRQIPPSHREAILAEFEHRRQG